MQIGAAHPAFAWHAWGTPRPCAAPAGVPRCPRDEGSCDPYAPLPGEAPFHRHLEIANRLRRAEQVLRPIATPAPQRSAARLRAAEQATPSFGEIAPARLPAPCPPGAPAGVAAARYEQVIRRPFGTGSLIDVTV